MNLTNLPMSLDEVPLPSPLPPVILTVFTRPDLLKEVLKGLTQQTLSESPRICEAIYGSLPLEFEKSSPSPRFIV
ncbi:MAG: hypothetical protein GPJ17_07675 [Microcystis aeruginosa K13-07]|jgi:hypothetical protein|nr:hypothetical protein [Microcystis aeruginosa K13-07]